jgi:2-polyprenyl-3-methyl-5-hydroxy-6-metoxy-1,4-benzoquinol methylase
MKCRFCTNNLSNIFIDLVNAPPSNSYLTKKQLNEPETYYPLKVFVCEKCWTVQIDEYKNSDEIFDKNYAYFSSYSRTWLKHSSDYVNMITDKLNLTGNSLVMEIASNDGYLLQYFKNKNIPCMGIEPTLSTANVAIEKNIKTIVDFFSVKLATELANDGNKADLILGNNVLAHVPNIKDFVLGLKIALKETGTITLEFPHLLNLIKYNQFDTIYHEHFSYLSLTAVNKIFKSLNLDIYNVEELTTHGGSLRIYAKHSDNTKITISSSVAAILEKESDFGLLELQVYKGCQSKFNRIKNEFLGFLLEQNKKGKIIAGYGAAAKGNTLINYAGIKHDLLSFVADASPHKQNKYLPCSHIPIFAEDKIKKIKPDFVVIVAWNLKKEISEQLDYIRKWGGKFVIAIPELEIF